MNRATLAMVPIFESTTGGGVGGGTGDGEESAISGCGDAKGNTELMAPSISPVFRRVLEDTPFRSAMIAEVQREVRVLHNSETELVKQAATQRT